MTCYFSTGAFAALNLREIVSISLEHGINVELGSEVAYEPGMLEEVRQAKSKVSFLVHNYFPPQTQAFVLNLASDDMVIHQKSVEMCRKAIDICVEIGSPFYSVHAGFAFHITPGMLGNPVAQSTLDTTLQFPREKAYNNFVGTVRDLSNYARRKNIQLLIENNVVTGELLKQGEQSPLLLGDIWEISRFFADVDDLNVRLLLDAGHAKVTATALGVRPERFFDVLAPYIRALHLSENDGMRDKHARFNAKAWFSPFLKDYRKLPMVIEVHSLSMDEILEQRQILAAMVS